MKDQIQNLLDRWNSLDDNYTDESHKKIIDEFENLILDNPNIEFDANLSKETNQMYETFELHTEIKQSKEVKVDEFLQTTCEFAKLEINKSSMSYNSRVCFVGGGYFPESVMTYNICDCCLTCIDRDIKAIESARKHFDQCKYVHTNAFDIDYSNYDIIIIAAFVKDKSELIDHIAKTSKKGTKIICRNTSGNIRYMHEPIKFIPESVVFIEEFKTNSSVMHAILLEVI